MMGPQPFALALMTAKHRQPPFNRLADINVELGSDFIVKLIQAKAIISLAKGEWHTIFSSRIGHSES
jgi:hypothetical protein